MGEKKSKWLEHLKAAESSGLKLSAYAAQHQIDVRRLYEAKRKRAQQAASNWAVVRKRSINRVPCVADSDVIGVGA